MPLCKDDTRKSRNVNSSLHTLKARYVAWKAWSTAPRGGDDAKPGASPLGGRSTPRRETIRLHSSSHRKHNREMLDSRNCYSSRLSRSTISPVVPRARVIQLAPTGIVTCVFRAQARHYVAATFSHCKGPRPVRSGMSCLVQTKKVCVSE